MTEKHVVYDNYAESDSARDQLIEKAIISQSKRIDTLTDRVQSLDLLLADTIEQLTLAKNQLNNLEMSNKRLERGNLELQDKIDKLITANKSLVQYFTCTQERDARDLNYRIRGYAAKSNFPPAAFVPNKTQAFSTFL